MNDTAWADQATIRVELGTGETFDPDAGATWGAAQWSADSRWSGVEPLWVDVTCHFRSVETSGGVDYTVGRFATSSAQLVAENASGWASLLAQADYDIRVRRQMRAVATITRPGPSQGLEVPLFRGYIDMITPTYLANGRPAVQFDLVDAMALFAADDPLELAAEVGAGELSGARIGRILNRVGWPKALRNVAPGQVAVQATTMARNYADEMGVTADTEGGALYVDAAGLVTFRDRDWLRTQGGPSFTIGNTAGADVCPTSWVVGQSMGEIVSQVALSNAGGTARHYVDQRTFAQVGPALFPRFDLIATSDAQLDLLAGRILAVRGYVTARVRGAGLSMLGDPRWAGPILANLGYGTRFLANYQDPAGGEAFTLPTVTTRIAHRIDADGDWVLTLGLEDATPYQPAKPWGVARWALDNWTNPMLAALERATRDARALRDAMEVAP
jgi:hypothetical protein